MYMVRKLVSAFPEIRSRLNYLSKGSESWDLVNSINHVSGRFLQLTAVIDNAIILFKHQ